MSYINLSTLKVAESQDIINENPNTSFPNTIWTDEFLLPFGYANLNEEERPIPERYQVVVEVEPKKKQEKWYRSFVLQEMSEEQKNNTDARKNQETIARRDELLRQSDWTQLPDVNLSNKQEWMIYRQQLRDLTQQSGFPWEVVWPAIPQQ